METETSKPKRAYNRRAPLRAEAEQRSEVRPQIREEDPRTRAARRAAEIRQHNEGASDAVDEFYVDHSKVPEGWGYEWKMHTVVGKEDPSYQVSLAQAGWEPVPASRHPEMMPKGYKGQHIERKGMILMERPLELIDDAKRAELRKARMQVSQKQEQVASAPQGQFERRKSDGSSLAKINKSYSPVDIPE